MEINRNLIEKIIIESRNAPSGSNSQPWEFICQENSSTIKLRYLPEKDHPILNYRNRGTLIASGAFLENIHIVSKHYGLQAQIEIAPDFKNKIVAEIKLNPGAQDDELYSFVQLRSSNRKPYKKNRLEENIKNYLLQETQFYPKIFVNLIENEELIKKAGSNLAYDIFLNFKNKYLYEQMGKELLFDDELAKQGQEGLYVKTMEFKGPQLFLVKKLLNRKFLEFMERFHIVEMIYKNVAKLYSSASALVSFSVVNDDKEFISLGRLVENIWLRATKLGLSCHFITGIPFLWQKVNFESTNLFEDYEKNIINSSYTTLKDIFTIPQDKIFVGVLRVGYSSPPSGTSVKKIPKIIFEK